MRAMLGFTYQWLGQMINSDVNSSTRKRFAIVLQCSALTVAIAALSLASCVSSKAIVNDTVCHWNEELDECFCVSHVAVRPTITWAPAEACGVYGVYELDCEMECDCNEVAK
jgi:hypothetical protein